MFNRGNGNEKHACIGPVPPLEERKAEDSWDEDFQETLLMYNVAKMSAAADGQAPRSARSAAACLDAGEHRQDVNVR